jgi:Domain of unknown function (DUF4416)
MGKIRKPAKVKLLVGLLGRDREILEISREILSGRFGREEEVMEPIPFSWTHYYAGELGAAPLRTFVSYETWVDREFLVEAKLATNAIEMDLSRDGLRRVNLDPGYLTLGQLFLASTKDQRWRVYVRDGIFVEPTLYFQDGAFHPFPWTYRDYQSPEYRDYMARARSKLAYQRNHEGKPYSTRLAKDPE